LDATTKLPFHEMLDIWVGSERNSSGTLTLRDGCPSIPCRPTVLSSEEQSVNQGRLWFPCVFFFWYCLCYNVERYCIARRVARLMRGKTRNSRVPLDTRCSRNDESSDGAALPYWGQARFYYHGRSFPRGALKMGHELKNGLLVSSDRWFYNSMLTTLNEGEKISSKSRNNLWIFFLWFSRGKKWSRRTNY